MRLPPFSLARAKGPPSCTAATILNTAVSTSMTGQEASPRPNPLCIVHGTYRRKTPASGSDEKNGMPSVWKLGECCCLVLPTAFKKSNDGQDGGGGANKATTATTTTTATATAAGLTTSTSSGNNNNMSSSSAAAVSPQSTVQASFAQYPGERFVQGGGVAIFHLKSERVVICSAEDRRGRTFFFLPKGRRDAGEDASKGAEREGFEEVSWLYSRCLTSSAY